MFLEKGQTPDPAACVLRNSATAHVIASTIEPALSRESRNRGLLGRAGLGAGHALLIAPCFSIHTWFMRFNIDLIFLTREGRVVKTRSDVPPWRLAFGWGAYAVVELPAGTIEAAGVKRNDRLELAPK